jgi:hypothetical protein
MTNQLTKILACWAFFGFGILFTQCGGKDDEEVKVTSEYLTSSKWRLDQITSDDLDATSLSFYLALFENYELTYRSDGTYEAILPSFGEFGTSEGKWELSTDEKTLFHDKGTELEEMFVIQRIDNNRLHLESTIEDDDTGGSFTVLMGFRH